MKVKLKNIQSFKTATFDFPETGLVQIAGGNSNGKSILGKVIKAIATLNFIDQAERDSLLRDGEKEGYIILEYKGKVLVIYLHTERNQCFVQLIRSNKEKITRTIRESGIAQLIEEFGFRVYGKNSVVLQLHDTFGVIPFVNTSNSLNYEIIDAVTTDTIAQQFIKNFKEITFKEAKLLIDTYNQKIDGITKAISTLALYDHVAYQQLYEEMSDIYKVIKHIQLLNLEKILLPPKVRLIQLPTLRLEKIPLFPKVFIINIPQLKLEKIFFIKVFPILSFIEDLTETIYKINRLKYGRCPVCGKLFLECKKEEYV